MLVLAIGLLIARSIYLNSVAAQVDAATPRRRRSDAMVYFIKVGLRFVFTFFGGRAW